MWRGGGVTGGAFGDHTRDEGVRCRDDLSGRRHVTSRHDEMDLYDLVTDAP